MGSQPEMIAPMDIHGLIGLGVRARREELGLRQEDVAKEIRDHGLPAWRRSTVAQIEAGTRRPSLGDLLLIALALDCTLADLVPADAPDNVDLGTGVSLWPIAVKMLLSDDWANFQQLPADAVRMHSTSIAEAVEAVDEAFATAREQRELYERTQPQVHLIWDGSKRPVLRGDIRRSYLAATEAEQRAAERLGVPSVFLKAAAGALWDRDFEKERDARAGNGGLAPSGLQARRGHATRAMLGELRDYLGELGVLEAQAPEQGGPGDE